MKLKKIPFKEFVEIYHKVPRATIDVIVVSKKGFLLTRRAIPPFKGMWHIPGGTILFMEPIKNAINRIIKEELGVKLKDIKHLGIIEYFNDEGRHSISSCYLAKIKNGKPRGSKQGKKINFFKKVPQKLIPEQKTFINKYLQTIKGCLL